MESKIRVPTVKHPELSKILSYEPGVGQNIALQPSPAAQNSACPVHGPFSISVKQIVFMTSTLLPTLDTVMVATVPTSLCSLHKMMEVWVVVLFTFTLEDDMHDAYGARTLAQGVISALLEGFFTVNSSRCDSCIVGRLLH